MGYLLQAGSIHFSRAVYALNWFVMAPSLIYISSSLKLQLIQLGVVTTGFYAGIAAFQLIGGTLASRIGNMRIAILGITILGSSTVMSGFSPDLAILLASRVTAGIGAALFFSPGIGALSNIVPQDRFGTHVGIYNGSFNIGAGIGILGWSILDKIYGWRPALIFSGFLALVLAAENFLVLRGVKEEMSLSKDIPRKIVAVSRMPHIWILSIAGFSSIAGETLIGQFFVYYAEHVLDMSAYVAGSLAGISMVAGIVGGIFAGKMIQQIRRKGTVFFLIMLIGGLFIALIPSTANAYILLAILCIEGLLIVSGFSVLYTMVAMEIVDRSMVSFSLALTNTIQMGFSVAVPLLYALLASYSNYEYAWIISGILAIAMSAFVYVGRGLRSFPRIFPET